MARRGSGKPVVTASLAVTLTCGMVAWTVPAAAQAAITAGP
jgi:hypothetical protein